MSLGRDVMDACGTNESSIFKYHKIQYDSNNLSHNALN